MVVGAGRGPLVRALLSAADKAQRKVKVYAVEKNPNAIVTWVFYAYSLLDFLSSDLNFLIICCFLSVFLFFFI